MDPGSMTPPALGWLLRSLVTKTTTALLEAWASSTGLGKEFKTLKNRLLKFGDLLTSSRSLRTNNSFLEELVQEIEQLTYQTENLLDELDYYRLEDQIQQTGTRLASRSILSHLKGMSCCSALDASVPLPKTFESRINLSRRMTELAKQLQKSEEKVSYALQIESLVIAAQNTETSQTEATNIPLTSSFLTEPRVVFGRDKEGDYLMNLLTNKETAVVGKVPVLAIIGSGGVGKTTLAGKVFNDPKVHRYFEVRLWICVSTRFDIVRLTREMLEGVCGNRCDLSNLNELQNKLKNELDSKRFLLVLDDMWEDDKNQWDSMVAPLNKCMVKGSIILVTTRNQSVAKMVDSSDNIYLEGLEYNAFLSFFSTCIFNDPNFGGNWRLRKIGQQIANKLNGNPLAAKTVSALLKEKLDERYWMEIRDSEKWKFQSGQNHIMPALRLSYEHMPFHLQRCFSYCAILLEDHPFTCEELVYQWMAQGFLDVRPEGKMMEDIGNAYFNDLFNRGFFQIKQSTDGLVYFTFHDLLHDLAHMVSFKECLTINGPKPRQIPPTIRHLSIFYSTKKAEPEEAIVRALAYLEGVNLRTIFNWDELPSGIFRSISDLLKETKFLRAVRLNLCSPVQPHNLNFQNLVSLRYLSLNLGILPGSINTTSYALPREICWLYHLEVFQIEGGCFLDELPNNFSDLVSLRHFIVEGKLHSKICGVGKLTSVQELNHFDVQQKIGFEIEQLGSLREIGGSLHIWNLENVKSKSEASMARLAEKEKLDALYLQWNHGEQENESVLEGLKPNTNLKSLGINGYGGVASPTWLGPSLVFLESLTLEDCKAWELLPPLGELEYLKHLKLSGLAVREIGLQCYGTRQSQKISYSEESEIIDMPYLEKFQLLEELEIKEMPDLKKWVWSDHFVCFKKLKKLTIRDCPKLVDLPLSGSATSEVLERFASLERLVIENCPLIFQLQPLPPIGELAFLKCLKLSGLVVREIGPQCYGTRQSMKFPSLEKLKITDMPYLEKWVWSEQLQHFLYLKKLKIQRCDKLVDLPLSGCATSKVLKRFPSLESLKIEDCPLIFQLPPFPYSSVLSNVRIARTGFIKSMHFCFSKKRDTMHYEEKMQYLHLIMDQRSSLKVGELLAFHELSYLHYLEISCISSLESLDLHSFVALKHLLIKECQSLTSLTFGEHLVCLKRLEINSCKTLSTMKGLKSWVNLETLYFRECPGFIAACNSALNEIKRTEPDFSLSLIEIQGDSLDLLTLPICMQLSSLQILKLEFAAFIEEHEVSLLLLKNMKSFPFSLFPSLKELSIEFPRIPLPTNSCTEITEECKKQRNIEEVDIFTHPFQIHFKLSSAEIICQQMGGDTSSSNFKVNE